MHDVLIGITCRNYEQYIGEALRSASVQGCAVLVVHDDCGGEAPQGVAHSRNTIAAYATVRGFKYVVFLDADDVMPFHYVHGLLKVANDEECVVACDADVFGTESGTINVKHPITLSGVLALNTIHVSALVPTSLFEKHGGFNPLLDAYEDWDLWCRFLAGGAEFRYSPFTRLRVRRHGLSRHANKKTKLEAMRDTLRQRYQENLSVQSVVLHPVHTP